MRKYLFTWLILFVAVLSGTAVAQNKVTPRQLEHLNNTHLRKLQQLLLMWQNDTMEWDAMTHEKWQCAPIYVDEKNQAIVHKVRPYSAGDSSNTWTVTYRIPIGEIVSVTQDDDRQAIVIQTKGSDITVFEADYMQPAGKENKLTISCNLHNVRNLSGQVQQTIRQYNNTQAQSRSSK